MEYDMACFRLADGSAKSQAPVQFRPAPRSFGEAVSTFVADGPAGAKLDASHIQALYFLSLAQPQVTRERRLYRWVKSLADRVFAAALLIMLAPAMLLIAIAVKITSPGPALLVQERVGKGGRVFSFFKFRSMYNHTDHAADQAFARDYINGRHKPISGGVFKPANDKRVTPLGRVLRKTSLDELPQIWNVLKGEMSLVGPRPEQPALVEKYAPWQRKRFTVPQGITGWWQVHERSDKPMHLHTEEDLYYVQNYSIWLDFQILLMTLIAVLRGKGAY